MLVRKLKSKAGESLVESLAAILIFTLASIVLYTMVTAAGDINSKAKALDRSIQDQLTAVEKGQEGCHSGHGSVKLILGEQEIGAVDVCIYSGEDGLFAFFAEPEGGCGLDD